MQKLKPVFIALLLAFAACDTSSSRSSSGPSSGTPAPQQSGPGKVGQRVESSNVALTVIRATKQDALGEYFKADAGKVYLVTEVLIEATQDKAPYNPLYFKVKDASGYEYTAAIPAMSDALKSGELSKGERVRGAVAFEIPMTARELVLSYEPMVVGDFKPIKVALD